MLIARKLTFSLPVPGLPGGGMCKGRASLALVDQFRGVETSQTLRRGESKLASDASPNASEVVCLDRLFQTY